MKLEEVIELIKEIPLGSTLEVIKKNGDIIQVSLQSHEVEGTEKKVYNGIEVPALPPALIVGGGTRFGNWRLDIEDLVQIARVG